MTTPTILGVRREDLLQAACNAFAKRHRSEECSAAAEAVYDYIATHHKCALPATWDDGAARPVEGKHGWVTPLLPDGSQRLPDGTLVEGWHPGLDDGHRFPYYVAGNRYSHSSTFGGLKHSFPWNRGSLIRPTLPPACDHADEWAEVDGWSDLPDGTRLRREWERGAPDGMRYFAHRDDMPDPDAAKVERMAKAIFRSEFPNSEWGDSSEDFQEDYRDSARAALAASREDER